MTLRGELIEILQRVAQGVNFVWLFRFHGIYYKLDLSEMISNKLMLEVIC